VKGAERVAGDAEKVLYLVISGAPAPEGLPSLVGLLQGAGWRVVAFSTPMGTRFADMDELERLTGEPVRWEYRMPGTGSRTPTADVVLACPLSFNSVNKFAHGHADNFAVGLLCESDDGHDNNRRPGGSELRPGAVRRLPGAIIMPGRGTGTPAPAAGTVMSTTPLLAALPTVPGLARDHVKVTLAEWGLGGVADAAELIADREMTANAVNASALVQAAVGLLVIRLCLVTDGETLTIECWDQAPGVPVLRPAPGLAETGRGLAIIDALSGGAWGSQPCGCR
jgi:anti-sigma regulatory factor (Ser/Thr protein kinase)